MIFGRLAGRQVSFEDTDADPPPVVSDMGGLLLDFLAVRGAVLATYCQP
jgi:hypothetical protein